MTVSRFPIFVLCLLLFMGFVTIQHIISLMISGHEVEFYHTGNLKFHIGNASINTQTEYSQGGLFPRVNQNFAQAYTKQDIGKLARFHVSELTRQHALKSSTTVVTYDMTQRPQSSVDASILKTPNVLNGCGQICQNDLVGQPSKFFEFIKKDFDCEALWMNTEIDQTRTGSPVSLSDIPIDMLSNFTYNHKVPITPYVMLLDQPYLGSTGLTPTWEEDMVNDWAFQCAKGILEGNYGKQETSFLLQGLLQVPNLSSSSVLVIGSENPWVEACVLSTGVSNITTLEYGKIDSRHPKIKTITPYEIRGRYADFFQSFDVIVTFSSVEHAGLGRYGDKLNPWGDRQAVARAWCATKPGGYMVIGVPYGRDSIEYNAHRIYGSVMYPHLVANWYQHWRAEGGDQRVHLLRKSLDGYTDPGHSQPSKALCLVGPLYGQSNNQILSLSWARMLAEQAKLSLLMVYESGDEYLIRNWHKTFGNIPGMRWGGPNQIAQCEKTMTWEDSFNDMIHQRRATPDSDWPLIVPTSLVKDKARLYWEQNILGKGAFITVHGRSFEHSSEHCMGTGQSAYVCTGEHLCDYTLQSILERFGKYLGSEIQPYHFMLFTDGQDSGKSQTYPMVEQGGDLFVHMWVMALSRIHIAHPGSSMDYVIWRWRQQVDNATGTRLMLPWNCYSNQTDHTVPKPIHHAE
jgi:hypothetical protein